VALAPLRAILRSYQKLAIAFSGGVDSSVLLCIAKEILGPENVLALTIKAPIFPPEDLALAAETAWRLGLKVVGVEADLLALEAFTQNPPDRCYYCKKYMYEKLLRVAHYKGFDILADGTHADDLSTYRPGLRALKELGVVTPLVEAGVSKKQIRLWAYQRGLRQAQRPAAPCLATRFPHGSPIRKKYLQQILQAERIVRAWGLESFRVRHLEQEAVLEIADSSLIDKFSLTFLIQHIKDLGFTKFSVKIIKN